ncbi:MAG: HD domain-containing protein [Deltaproteobacteria bacterium]|nr:HD domain-containing protein [Deltaproteobacteria bacterium]
MQPEHILNNSLIQAVSKLVDGYLVGGYLRDYFLNKPFQGEVDLIVGNLQKVVEYLRKKNISWFRLSDRYETVRAFHENVTFDFTEIRGDLISDLSGRDFTVNAIAQNVSTGEIVDPFGGLKDLDMRILRLVSLNSISEDSVRILRAVRFGPGIGFTVHEDVIMKIKESLESLQQAKPERKGAEFFKILKADYVGQAFRFMNDMLILDELFSLWPFTRGFLQNEFHTEDVSNHILTVIERCEDISRTYSLSAYEKQILVATGFFHDIAKPQSLVIDKNKRRRFYNHEFLSAQYAEAVLKGFALEQEFVQAVKTLVKLHMRPLHCGPSGARRIRLESGKWFNLWRLFKIADKPPIQSDEQVLEALQYFDTLVLEATRPHKVTFLFNGNTLKKLGFTEGVFLGRCLRALKRKALENEFCNDEKFVSLVASRFKKS